MRETLTQVFLLLALTAIAAVGTGWLHPRAPAYAPREVAEPSPLAITWSEVTALDGPVQWVDARTEEAYAQRHAPGAVLLSENRWDVGFEELILGWSPDETVVVYCDAATCHTSEAVAIRLRRELGAENIYFLEGGWSTWQAHN